MNIDLLKKLIIDQIQKANDPSLLDLVYKILMAES